MNKKSTSVAYTHLNTLLKKYHDNRHPLINLDLFVKELRETGQRGETEDPEFPIEFFYEASHALIAWCMGSFQGLPRDGIGPMLQRLWGFHKRMMEYGFSDDDTEKLIVEAEAAIKDIERSEERALYMAVLHEYDRLAKIHDKGA